MPVWDAAGHHSLLLIPLLLSLVVECPWSRRLATPAFTVLHLEGGLGGWNAQLLPDGRQQGAVATTQMREALLAAAQPRLPSVLPLQRRKTIEALH
jgi:hypothetical protein